MANYKLESGASAVPVYPLGKSSFTTNDEVKIRVRYRVKRDVSDPTWFSWASTFRLYAQDNTLLFERVFTFRGSPPSLTQDVDYTANLGVMSPGRFVGYATVQCSG